MFIKYFIIVYRQVSNSVMKDVDMKKYIGLPSIQDEDIGTKFTLWPETIENKYMKRLFLRL